MVKINLSDINVPELIVDIWSPLNDEQREFLANHFTLQNYKKNEVIHCEGETPTHLMCLLSGKVKIYKDGVGGRSQIIRMIKPTEYFGYRPYFAKADYVTAACAFEPSLVCLIPMTAIMTLLSQNNELAMFFIRRLSIDLGIADERTVNLTQKHIRGRLAESLIFLKESYGLEEDGSTLSIYLSREDPNAKTEDNKADDQNTEKKEEDKTIIYYVTDEIQQSQYINMFKKQGMDAVILGHNIDSPFITQLEQRNQNIKFQRIDADVTAGAKEEVAEEEKEAFQKTSDSLVEIFRKELGDEKLDVKIEKLKDENIASMMTLSEENRRMQEMMKMYGMSGMDMGTTSTLILNANHPLVEYVVAHKDGENTEMFCHQLYDLAMLAHKPLSPEEMTEFVKRSNEIMMKLAK